MMENKSVSLPVRCEPANRQIEDADVVRAVAQACPVDAYRRKRVLLIVPDGTRTAPIGMVFKAIFNQLGAVTEKLDVIIALGTHHPMSEAAICQRLEISLEERRGRYGKVVFHNHAWNNADALREIGVITAEETHELTGGLFSMDVPVEINRLVFQYDQLIIIGPVFPHEVVGCSGGNKYLFPGIAGPEIRFRSLPRILRPVLIGVLKWAVLLVRSICIR